MLQEFCATRGYSPSYAAHLLRTYAKRVILGQVTLVLPCPLVQGEGRCPFPSLSQERQLLRGEQELDPGTQVPGIPQIRYQESTC